MGGIDAKGEVSMRDSMLLSEWIRLYVGISMPDFTLLGGGVPDVIAHLLIYFTIAIVAANFVLWFYSRFIETETLRGE